MQPGMQVRNEYEVAWDHGGVEWDHRSEPVLVQQDVEGSQQAAVPEDVQQVVGGAGWHVTMLLEATADSRPPRGLLPI